MTRKIVLASTSPWRRQLLQCLLADFDCLAPEVDESPLPGEAPAALALRLSRAKAAAIGEKAAQALVIGSDQVADLDGHCLGKPGNHQAAMEQLRRCRGKTVEFHTGLCLRDNSNNSEQSLVSTTRVVFRQLSGEQIDHYLQRDQPYDCAGSFKVESAGIALFSKIESDDPNSLIGLPLIHLVDMLHAAGVDVLKPGR